MARRSLALLAVLLVLVPIAGTPAAAQTDKTDEFIRAQMGEFHLPGLSLAVIRNGEIVKASGYGLADAERKIPATPETVYRIGSVSKQFMAAGIMLLAAEGCLGLDDPIGRFIEGIPAAWKPITIRHLLTHTSGLVRESPAFSPFKQQGEAELIRALHGVPLRFAPGTKWEYSNSGYIVLAEIIRVVSGQPWTEYLREKIFAPAGMNATLPTNMAASVPNRAAGYGGRDNVRRVDDWPALRPSGAFLSTVLDLAKWDAALYTDRVLNEPARRQMWTPIRLSGGSAAPYGLGWHIETMRGGTRIWHGGGLPGFSAHFARLIDDSLTVAVLTNGEDVDLYTIATGVAALYVPPRGR